MAKKFLESRPVSFMIRLVSTFLTSQVPRTAAQMSYYLLFSLFPLLLIVVSALGFFRLDVNSVLNLIERISPGAYDVLGEYVAYVVSNESPALMAAGIIMALTASSAAFRGLMRITGEIAGQPTFHGPVMFGVSLVMSVVLLLMIFICLLVTVTGRWFLTLLVDRFHFTAAAWVWQWLRFPILFALGVLALTALYRVSLSKKALPGSRAWPGAVFASVGLVIGTGVFSMFISLSSRYSMVYGSLASTIILLLWLFVCSNILVAGSLLNCLIARKD